MNRSNPFRRWAARWARGVDARNAAPVAVLLALALPVFGILAFALEGERWPLPTTDSWDDAEVTTFREILDGGFRSATDKSGMWGVAVIVHNVTFNRFFLVPTDGDWHVHGDDPTAGNFITEIIPRDQTVVGRPPLDVPLTVLGVPYCDRGHEDQQWHNQNCWELHPLLGWRPET